IFNDPIHGHIELHPLCVKIIDTPEFQRLRFIKQLGACYFVYPGASHNRFEHSLGVCHLAGELVRAIKNRQPQLHVSSKDILCVEIAGLCHDLGHGPFSHLFDRKFIPQALPDGVDWEHEEASVDMFDHLVKKNGLDTEFDKYGLTDMDRTFIKEQIKGPSEEGNMNLCSPEVNDFYKGEAVWLSDLTEMMVLFLHPFNTNWRFEGRDKSKGFLYEDMFNTRVTLHKRAYQHRVNAIIEHMITEAFLKADEHLKFLGADGKLVTMSQSIHDMEAYSKLTDSVFDLILMSTDPNLKEARDILTKVLQRKLYKCVGQTKPKDQVYKKSDAECIKKEIVAKGQEKDRQNLEDNLIVEIISMDYGMKDSNPIDHVRFYDKRNPEKPMVIRKEEVSRMTPKEFTDQNVYLFTRRNDKEFYQTAMETFKQWCGDKQFSQPRGGTFANVELTPYKRRSSDTEESVSKKARRDIAKTM
ncbi:deoxynucleoside triphosphate triphosphohydrolase SAMHD1-like, partial [Mizuhopecten yessoensis]|uniref:deoxynucleoside triphosphate triphosphohydrolase SAMHD1-like n=1 Tax=Mizuhopecten yessoensis TaxID=6573 RepID=UPI000B45B62F